ncbi:hypothetical protein RUND412_010186 [Rhizina undulata]
MHSAPGGPYNNHPKTFNGVPIGARRVEEMAARVAWLRTQPPDVQARQRQVLRQWEIYEEMLQQRQQRQGLGQHQQAQNHQAHQQVQYPQDTLP